jgi:hypothetical protein
MAMGNRIRGTSLHTIPAENTSGVVDVIHACITFTGRNALCVRVFRRFNVNTIGGTCRGAQKTPNALLQSALVAMQDVDSSITRLKMYRLVWIILRDRLPKHIPECDTESLGQGGKRLGDFADDGGHRQKV